MPNEITIENHTIKISNIKKLLFPADDITKGDMIEYYQNIADVILPHIQDRPLAMIRYPDGINKESFFQQSISSYYPEWIERVSVEKQRGSIIHIVCQNKATLVYLANQACIVFHMWLSRRDKLNNPDQLIFDLVPPDNSFRAVKDVALILKKFLQELELNSFLKTTGSRGLHVVVPLNKSADFDTVRSFAQDVAEILSKYEPEKITSEQRKEKRKDRVFLDFVRNSYGQLVVAPYSLRAKPGAPVATPLNWNELSDKELNAQSYNLKNIFQRLSRRQDPWERMWHQVYSLDKAQKKLHELKKTFKSHI